MRILHVLNHFLPSNTAGTEVYAWSLAKQLKTKGIKIKVLIPHYKQSVSADYIYDGLQVCQFAEPSLVDRSLIMGFRKPDGINSFIEHLNSEKLDIIHFHEIAGSNGITIHHVEAAKKTGARVLFTFHLSVLSCMTGTLMQNGIEGCDGKIDVKKCTQCYLKYKKINPLQQKLLSWFSLLLIKIGFDTRGYSNKLGTALGTSFLVEKKKKELISLLAHCDKVIVLTKWYREILLANGIPDDKIFFIPQGLPEKSVLKNSYKSNTDKLKFIFVGRISQFKGLHLLIDAFKKLNSNAVQLDIYGQADDVDYESNLKKLAVNMPCIQWKGLLPHENVVQVMAQYDALCLCSTFSEMSPLVIQEAFAAGIPVIASNVYGNAEQIKHDVNGLLFKFNDSVDLLKQLQRCINEKDLLPNLSSNILPPRSFEEVANEHIKLYNSLLS